MIILTLSCPVVTEGHTFLNKPAAFNLFKYVRPFITTTRHERVKGTKYL